MDERDQHIIRWIEEYLSGDISEEHRADLESWLDEKEANRYFFEQLCKDRSFQKRWEQRSRIDPLVAIRVFDERTATPVVKIRRWGWLKYAGVAALLVMAVVFSLLYRDQPETLLTESRIGPGAFKAMLVLADGKQVQLEAKDSLYLCMESGVRLVNQGKQLSYRGVRADNQQFNELRIPRGGEYEIILADSTVVRLNSVSSLRYPIAFNKEKREVWLSGEACFEVKQDSVPFLVRVGDLTIQVYGTVFNVNTHVVNKIQTALIEGKVGITVAGDSEEYILSPSQLADFDRSSRIMSIQETDLTAYVAWTKGLFIFNNESLGQIMETLSLWYDIDVFYQNPELQKLHFTGYVKRYDDIDYILRALSQSVGVKFNQQGKTLTISY